ncbi:hypothetical protein ACLBTQ_28855, partial [Pseudomonas aeruginosa]
RQQMFTFGYRPRTLQRLHAGFSNLPSEWWHYDFGDQLWAWHTGATQALFGPVQLQAMDALWRQQLQKRPLAD